MTKVLSTWRCHLTVLLPLLLALVLRASYLATFFQTPGYRVPVVDAGYHDAWARGMAFDAWDYSKQHDVAAMQRAPYFRPPGYVYLLSAIYRVLGTDPFWPRLGNLVLGLLSILLLGAFAERVYGSRVAWLVRLLAGSYWGLIYFEGELLEVPLLVFAATACLYGLLRAESAGRGAATPIDDHRPQSTPGGATPSTLLTGVDGGCRAASAAGTRAAGTPFAWRACVWALAAGVALGVHAIARPNILLVAPVLAAWLGWRVWRRSGQVGRTVPVSRTNRIPGSGSAETPRPTLVGRANSFITSAFSVERSVLSVSAGAEGPVPAHPLTHAPTHSSLRNALSAMASLTFGTLLVILPVTLRNRVVGGEWVLISTNGGINLYIGNNDQAEGLFIGRTDEFNHFGDSGVYEKILADLSDEKGRRPSYREADRYFAEKAVSWMREHPWRMVELMGRKLVYLASSWETGHNRVIYWERRKLPVIRWLPGNWGVLLALCVAAGVLGFNPRQRQTTTVDPHRVDSIDGTDSIDGGRRGSTGVDSGFAVSGSGPGGGLVLFFGSIYALSFLPFFVTGQYRMPLVPWLCLGAAVGIDRMIQAARYGAWRRVVLAGVVAGLVYTGAAVNWLDFKPNLTKWYFDEALSYESIGQVDQAAAMYREATRSDGDTRRSWYNLGLLESTRGRHQVAIEAFRRAIRAGMKGGRVWNDLGVALLRSGRATEARDALAEAVRLRPDRTDWRHNYAAALMASGGEDNRPLSTPSTTINPRRPVVDWR